MDHRELTACIETVDSYLGCWLDERSLPENLREAMRYALLGPGKRMRPILVIRCCEAVGGQSEQALAPAGAIEMIHAFSLVHDDLPALDNDDLRRGRPTLHRYAGEAMAILAGDALMGLAVELIAERVSPPELAHRIGGELIRASNDMISGQVYDTLPSFEASVEPEHRLRTIHRLKTGALIRASCRMGALSGGADDSQLDAITCFGEAIGLMFQVVDDLLDITQTTEHLGKTAGKDLEQEKLTYPAVLGVSASRREVRRLRDDALAALDRVGGRIEPLRQLCDYLAVRTK
jgi:geranylgeranyl diphosphate synthase type II